MKNSKDTTVLSWEWPAGRKPSARIAVHVQQRQKKSSGLFGLGRSPSIVENLPDPIDLTADVITGTDWLTTPSVELVLPEKEIPNIKRGDRIALGIVQPHTCICVASIPAEVTDIDAWLSRWTCGQAK